MELCSIKLILVRVSVRNFGLSVMLNLTVGDLSMVCTVCMVAGGYYIYNILERSFIMSPKYSIVYILPLQLQPRAMLRGGGQREHFPPGATAW